MARIKVLDDLPENVTVLDFEKWKKKPEVAEMYQEVDECDMCHGTGSHDCECGHTHECGECDGVGKERSLREIYERELRIEIKHLREWIEGLKTKTPTSPDFYDKNPSINIPVILESK